MRPHLIDEQRAHAPTTATPRLVSLFTSGLKMISTQGVCGMASEPPTAAITD
jgi:hypothetical protein